MPLSTEPEFCARAANGTAIATPLRINIATRAQTTPLIPHNRCNPDLLLASLITAQVESVFQTAPALRVPPWLPPPPQSPRETLEDISSPPHPHHRMS